jgi:hypothetical protein
MIGAIIVGSVIEVVCIHSVVYARLFVKMRTYGNVEIVD